MSTDRLWFRNFVTTDEPPAAGLTCCQYSGGVQSLDADWKIEGTYRVVNRVKFLPGRRLPSAEAAADQLQQNLRIAELEAHVRRMRKEIDELKRTLRGRGTTPTALPSTMHRIDPSFKELLKVTYEIFGSHPTLEIERDPESPDYEFVVLNVRCRAEVSEIVRKRREWHERVAGLPPGDSGTLRLSIDPV